MHGVSVNIFSHILIVNKILFRIHTHIYMILLKDLIDSVAKLSDFHFYKVFVSL